MPTSVRSYSKINLGLAIGAPRADGFHDLTTLYQTLAVHDVVTVTAVRSDETKLAISSNDPRVPCDGRNTVWKMVEKTLVHTGETARVDIHILKRLPIKGGMGAGSANAAAGLIGLERELGLQLSEQARLDLAAAVGSDVPLFLLGGSVLGKDRGQVVESVPDVTLAGKDEISCVVALPKIGVSTPMAFREWDRKFNGGSGNDLHQSQVRDTLEQLSRTYASVFGRTSRSGASGNFPDPNPVLSSQDRPENTQGLSREQRHTSLLETEDESGIEDDLAENSLLALVRTGMENDFETVVFPQYPSLREIKRHLMGISASGSSAVYASLSGSGSALFGLYRTQMDASAAQHRLQQHGVEAIVTQTMPRARYWREMFAM